MKKLLIVLTAAALVFPITGCVKFKWRHGHHGHHNPRHPHGGPPGQMKRGHHGPGTEVEIELPAAEIEVNTGSAHVGEHTGRGVGRGRNH
jgi:hypothetical protein